MNTQNRKLQTTGLDVNSEAFVAAPQTTDQRETCSRTAASKNTSGASNSQDLELRSIRCFARGWAAMCFSSMYFPPTHSHISPHEIKLWICENHGTANVSVNASCNCKCQMYISNVTAKLFDKKPHPSRYVWRTTKVTEQMPLHVHRQMFLQQPMQWQWQWSLARSAICTQSSDLPWKPRCMRLGPFPAWRIFSHHAWNVFWVFPVQTSCRFEWIWNVPAVENGDAFHSRVSIRGEDELFVVGAESLSLLSVNVNWLQINIDVVFPSLGWWSFHWLISLGSK